MKKHYLILALSFGITAATLPASAAEPAKQLNLADSTFEACKDVTFITKSEYKKDETFWKTAVEQCHADVQILPDNGFFAGILRSLKQQNGFAGDKARNEEFLRKVGSKTLEHLDHNIAVNGAIAACAAGKDQAADFFANVIPESEAAKKLYDASKCESTLDDVKDVAEEYGPKARVEYALTKKLQSVFGMAGDGIKWAGDKVSLDMKTAMDRAELSDKEKKEVEERFAKISKEIDAKFAVEMEQYEKDKAAAAKFVGGEAPAVDVGPIGIREHLRSEQLEIVQKELTATLQKAPMLSYVSKPGRMSNADLAMAMKEVTKNGVSQRKKVGDALAAADGSAEREEAVYDEMGVEIGKKKVGSRPVGTNERVKKMMEFMGYGPVLEEILREDPTFCGNAQKLADSVQGNKNKKMTVGIGAIVAGSVATAGLAPLLGASAVGATALGGAAGLVGGAATIYVPDYQAMKDAKERAHTSAHSVEGRATAGKEIGEMKDYEEARDAFVMDLATLPLDFVGAGFTPVVKTAAKDAALAAKLRFFERPAAQAAAKKALTKGGMSELQAAKILADLKGTEPVAQARALVQIAKALDVKTDEVKVLKNLYRTGVVKEVDGQSAGRALARIRAVPEAERPAMLARMDEILGEINTAKINAANRDDILHVAASGAQYGADAKKLASIATDWDGGLDGLARTFDRANKRMLEAKPDMRDLASLDATRRKNFMGALDDLIEENAELKKMSKAEKDSMKKTMCGCPGMCPL